MPTTTAWVEMSKRRVPSSRYVTVAPTLHRRSPGASAVDRRDGDDQVTVDGMHVDGETTGAHRDVGARVRRQQHAADGVATANGIERVTHGDGRSPRDHNVERRHAGAPETLQQSSRIDAAVDVEHGASIT